MTSTTNFTAKSAGDRWKKLRTFLGAGAAAAALMSASAANAGATIEFGDGQSINVGMGMRTSFTSAEDAAPNGSRSSDFELDSIRLYLNANLTDTIKGTFNTERNSDGDIKLLDGYARFEFNDAFNIWAGRMLPPSDRANLDGPYYLSSWNYPGVVSQYPAKFAGRDNGVTVWGKVFDKKLTYAVGAFEGHNEISGASSEGDNLLYAGRVAYNFWEVEDNPAYYTSSTYYGSADVLTLAFALQYQKDGVGLAGASGDYLGYNVDLLMEKKVMDGGAITLEGAYYKFDTDDTFDVAPGFGGAGSTDNVGGITQGDGYLVSAAFLFPQEVGMGKFQPVVRYQNFDADLTGVETEQYDFGVNYIIKGHNARLSAVYAIADTNATSSSDAFIAGLQLQF
ncbi:MAG: porin [Caulobacterales bacterium]